MGQKILTVPQINKNYKSYYLTGNHHVGIPLIDPENGGIETINIISMASNSLIEFYGSKDNQLIEPFIQINEEDINLKGKLDWSYKGGWIPEFQFNDQIKIGGRIFAPLGLKGFIYEIQLNNDSDKDMEVKVGLKGHWKSTRKTIYTQRLLKGTNEIYYDKWTRSIVMECNTSQSSGAFALGWDNEPDEIYIGINKEDTNYRDSEIGIHVDNEDRDILGYKVTNNLVLKKGSGRILRYFVASNMERDGARTSVVDIKRQNISALYDELIGWLDAKSLDAGDDDLNDVMNRNLFFNYFYALGKTIDTEEIVMMTSRSPRYYVSAAYWPRDTFLWSYPALLLVDTNLAREVLLTGYKRHIKNAGIHSHYINGTVLYPGFELDQLCSYIIALKGYVDRTKDYTIFREAEVVEGIMTIYRELQKHKGEINLYDTFLDPSDDPVTYPYLIYDNALVHTALKFLGEINSSLRVIEGIDFTKEAEKVKEAILKYGVVSYENKEIFAWAVDGKGKYEVYDNPPGSLMTLSHYEFVDRTDDIFNNTLDWIFSKNNKYFNTNGRFKGLGGIHAEGPWILAISNSILAGLKRYGKDFLKEVFMDNGFACETVDSLTGIAETGNAFATCGGFLAYSIYHGFGK